MFRRFAERRAQARRKRSKSRRLPTLVSDSDVTLEVRGEVGALKGQGASMSGFARSSGNPPMTMASGSEISGSRPPDLGERQRFELGDCRRAPRGDSDIAFHQRELLGAGKQELAVSIAMGVDQDLDVPQNARCILHLVDDDRGRVSSEKRLGLLLGLLGLGGKVERHESVFREQVAQASRSYLSGGRR